MNSFRAVERALEYEAERQWREWQETGRKLGEAPKQTRGWDDVAGVTRGQRSKEESSDYRYFPDPDLVPVTTEPAEVDDVRKSLGELPAALRARLETDFGLSAYDADVLVNQGRPVVDYFLDSCRSGWRRQGGRQLGDARCAANAQRPRHLDRSDAVSSSGDLAESDQQSQSRARCPARGPAKCFRRWSTSGVDAAAAMKSLGIAAVDESELVALCEKLLAANPKTIADVRAGKCRRSAPSSVRPRK